MLKPANDYLMIQVGDDKFGFDKNVGDAHTTGIVVATPEMMTHFGMHSFAFEESFMAAEKLTQLGEFLSELIGKRVFWLALQEKGAVLHDAKANKTYVFVKATSLIAVSDDDEGDVYSVLDNKGGAFSA